jgi:heavy metal sensor kinase
VRRRPFSIHTRLTLWYSGVLLATLLCVSALSYSVLAWNLGDDIDRSLLTVAAVVRDTGATDPFSPERDLRDALGRETFDHFSLFAAPGVLPPRRPPWLSSRQALPLSPEARQNAAHGRATFETITLPDTQEVRVVTLPVVRQGHVADVVQVGMSLTVRDRALRRYLQTLLVLVPIVLVLAATAGKLMARKALGPVDQISRAARRITAEELGNRVQVRGTGDELDRLAETLNEMLGRLEAAFSAMRRFSADAAHELRTPLTALKGGLEVALRAERSGEEYRRVLQASLEDVERLIRLSEDLLLLARASATPESVHDTVELEPLVLDVLDVGARLGAAAGVSVRLGEATALSVRGNPMALRRALVNLVENATKYTPRAGTVTISLAREGDVGVVAVEDTGPGIDPAEAARIFEAFVRLDAARARDTGGAGLGLAIARSIATAHGGTLTVSRGAAGGSRFTLRLPLG